MDEVFEHVRIEAEQGMEDADITPAEGAVIVDENGDVIEQPQSSEVLSNAQIKSGASATETAKVSLKKDFEKEIKGQTNDHNQTVSSLKGSVKVSASFALSASLSFKLYVSSSQNYAELQLSYSSAITFSATGAAQLTVPIGTVGFAPVAGCIVEITPSFIVKLSGELSASGTWTGSVGLRADADSGTLENISKAPKFTLSAKAQGTFYFGLDLMPKISLINEKILSMSMTGNVGVEIVAKMSGLLESDMNTDVTKMGEMHACNACIDGDLNFKYSLSFKVGLFKDKLSAELKLLDKTHKIGDFYYSFDYDELDFEECPHQLYRVELQCVNLKKSPIEGVSMEFTSEDTVMTADNVLWGTPLEGALLTDENGKAAVYLGAGLTTIESTKERFDDTTTTLNLTVDKNGDLKINNTKTNQYQIVMAPVTHTVSIHVENEEGEPLEFARISIAGDGDTKYTNASGDAELKLPNGTYELTVSDTGYQAVTQTLTIYDEGQSLSFQLVPDPYVYVRVTDEYGQPLQNAKVLVSGVNDLVPYTNAEGIYKTELEEGDYTMTVSKLNYETQECSFTFTGDFLQMDVVLVCTLPKVTVTVEDEAGNRIEGAEVTYEGSEDTVLTGADGTAVLRIPLGDCTIKASAEGFRSKSQVFTVDAEEAAVTLVLPPPMEIVSSTVSLGAHHSSAITEDGSLYLWGENEFGQLGNGTRENSSTPIKIMDNIAAVSLGADHSAAITEDGSLYLWGYNWYGQLGDGTTEHSYTPIKIMDGVAAVSLGYNHSAAITEDGSLYLWGRNYDGQLGDGTTEDSATPIKIMDNVAAVSLGGCHSAAITEDGSLYLWGSNSDGQLGNGNSGGDYWDYTEGVDSSTPVKIMDGVAIGGSAAPISPTSETLPAAAKSTVPLATSGTAATKSYTDLLPDTLYNFYVLRSDTAENLLSADNLLYLNQYVSANDGTLDITYTPIEDVADAVMLAVPAKRAISGASIVLEDMVYDGTTQTASPVVSYGGVSLIEGMDYALSGDTTADAVGAYMLTITGTGDYTGELTLSYWMYCEHSYADGACTLCGEEEPVSYLLGDLDEDGQVNAVDAAMILVAAASVGSGGESGLTEMQKLAADVNGDGECNAVDAAEVLRYAAAVGSGYTGTLEEFMNEA